MLLGITKQDIETVEKSRYFDSDWYTKEYPEIVYGKHNPTPAYHYLTQGWKEKKIPSVLFDGNRYASIFNTTSNPLVHYEHLGCPDFFPAQERIQECLLKLKNGFDLSITEKILYINILYKRFLHRDYLIFPNSRLLRLSDKIIWYAQYYQDPEMAFYADKFRSRSKLHHLLGKDYTVPLLDVYQTPDEINFEKLPDRFVLKTNWGAGQNIIVKDKSKANINQIKNQFKLWLDPLSNNYYTAFEYSYKDIPGCIIAEKYIENQSGDTPDLKILCFNGRAEIPYLVTNRSDHSEIRRSFFNRNYELLPFMNSEPDQHPTHVELSVRPKHYEQMLEISDSIAKLFPHVRVDFILSEDTFYLGEISFCFFAGFLHFTGDWDFRLGSLFNLPLPRFEEPINYAGFKNL